MGPARCVGTEVASGTAVARRFGMVAYWLAWGLDGATWGVGALRVANCCAQAEKPTTGSAGGGPGGGSMLLVDTVVCGANYYVESALATIGSLRDTLNRRFT